MTAIVGALSEAWQEIRVHKARFALSLLGVYIAVFAMTLVQAAGSVVEQVAEDDMSSYTGREGAATVSIEQQRELDDELLAQHMASLTEFANKVDASHYTLKGQFCSLEIVTGDMRISADDCTAVQPNYAEFRGVDTSSGRWLLGSDVDQRALQLVINPAMAEELGIPLPLQRPVAVEVASYGAEDAMGTIVGIYDSAGPVPGVYYSLEQGASFGLTPSQLSMEIWVGDELLEQFSERYNGTEAPGGVGKMYVEAGYYDDIGMLFTILRWATRIMGLFVLGLASLGVINVGIVTVRARVREIGVRRSYGASTGRVFAAIMLESVLASLLAAGAAVLSVIAIYRAPWPVLVREWVFIDSVPPFPIPIAVESLVLATIVGALAGLIPAIIAVRAKVIEAIRF